MTGTRVSAIALLTLMSGCAGGIYSIPHPIADAEPVPTRCPNYVPGCAQPTPTHNTPPPEPEPTATASNGGGGPKPQRTRTPRPGQTPPGTTPTVLPTLPGTNSAPKPPPGTKFVAFTFAALPFEQAFPVDPPPPPPPLKEPVPTSLVMLAGVLAGGVAASGGIMARRRGRMLVV